jgi:hypothetical protein
MAATGEGCASTMYRDLRQMGLTLFCIIMAAREKSRRGLPDTVGR